MTAGIKTLEIMGRPGAYEHLDKITGRLINGILDAGKAAGHDICGGHICGKHEWLCSQEISRTGSLSSCVKEVYRDSFVKPQLSHTEMLTLLTICNNKVVCRMQAYYPIISALDGSEFCKRSLSGISVMHWWNVKQYVCRRFSF